jgi:hypothetical protein
LFENNICKIILLKKNYALNILFKWFLTFMIIETYWTMCFHIIWTMFVNHTNNWEFSSQDRVFH